MSYQIGVVRWPEGTLSFYWYQNTADIAHPMLYPSLETLPDNPRNDPWRGCQCEGNDDVDVEVALDDRTWPGSACRKCRALTSGLDRDECWEFVKRGKPEWWPADLYPEG